MNKMNEYKREIRQAEKAIADNEKYMAKNPDLPIVREWKANHQNYKEQL